MKAEEKPEESVARQVELRASARFAVDAIAELLLVERGLKLQCRVLDLSEGGCRLHTEEKLPDGIHALVEVTFSIHGVPLRFSGYTQWIRAGNRVGIRFGEVPQRRRGVLKEVLEEIEEKKAIEVEKLVSVKKAEVERAIELPTAQRNAATRQSSRQNGALPAAVKAARDPSKLRAQPRYEVDDTAILYLVRSGSALRGRIQDLSQNGCRIHTEDPFPVGIYTRVEAEFQLQGLPFRLAGVTQAIYDERNVGVRFLDVSPRKREQLDQLMQEISERPRLGNRLMG
jgi:c-di-GMP-binding flagellar brake protein YcgR